MKVVKLCAVGSCCPEVKIMKESVVIGEDANTCTLTRAEWELLKQKIQSKEL
jgi:hypothetical protein